MYGDIPQHFTYKFVNDIKPSSFRASFTDHDVVDAAWKQVLPLFLTWAATLSVPKPVLTLDELKQNFSPFAQKFDQIQ